jgi:hypothetical protein
MKYSAIAAVDGGDKIVRTRDEVRGEVEIIHGGGNASDSMHVLIHGGFTVEVEPKTKWSAAVIKLAMAEMKSHNGWRRLKPDMAETKSGEVKLK